jgi:hypothetical protein
MINYCPLPLKRKFYGLKKDIETTLKWLLGIKNV